MTLGSSYFLLCIVEDNQSKWINGIVSGRIEVTMPQSGPQRKKRKYSVLGINYFINQMVGSLLNFSKTFGLITISIPFVPPRKWLAH